MTIAQVQKEFDEMTAKNDFTIAGYTSDTGVPICHRMWRRQDDTLEVRILLSGPYPLVTVKRNGIIDGNIIRDYSSPKRAMNAICKIVRCAGYEW